MTLTLGMEMPNGKLNRYNIMTYLDDRRRDFGSCAINNPVVFIVIYYNKLKIIHVYLVNQYVRKTK